MNILPTGSWEAFREWSPNGVFIPEEISDDIFLILKKEQQQAICEQIKDQYISGFKKEDLFEWELLEEILEQEETNVHKSDCHPGRFSLNPDAGVQAVLRNPALLCGGYAPRRLSSRKHRKLIPDVRSSARGGERMRLRLRGERFGGFQDIYFLGGLPLHYWSDGDQMGMEFDEGSSARHGVLRGGTEDDVRYRLTDGLLVFGEELYAGFLEWLGTGAAAGYLQRQEQAMIVGFESRS